MITDLEKIDIDYEEPSDLFPPEEIDRKIFYKIRMRAGTALCVTAGEINAYQGSIREFCEDADPNFCVEKFEIGLCGRARSYRRKLSDLRFLNSTES